MFILNIIIRLIFSIIGACITFGFILLGIALIVIFSMFELVTYLFCILLGIPIIALSSWSSNRKSKKNTKNQEI